MTPSIDDTSSLPREASIDRLETICNLVSENPVQKAELIDRLDANNDAVYDTVRLGIHLGLLKDLDRGVISTELGKQLPATERQSKRDIYEIALSNHEVYCDLLQTLNSRNLLFQGPLERGTVIEILQTEYGIDLSTKTMKERVGTFFQTLEAAGLGEYVFGGQNTICHFQFVDGFQDRLPNTLTNVDATETESGTWSNNQAGVQTTITGSVAEEDESESGLVVKGDSITAMFRFDIDDQTDPDQLEKLVAAIRRGLQGDD